MRARGADRLEHLRRVGCGAAGFVWRGVARARHGQRGGAAACGGGAVITSRTCSHFSALILSERVARGGGSSVGGGRCSCALPTGTFLSILPNECAYSTRTSSLPARNITAQRPLPSAVSSSVSSPRARPAPCRLAPPPRPAAAARVKPPPCRSRHAAPFGGRPRAFGRRAWNSGRTRSPHASRWRRASSPPWAASRAQGPSGTRSSALWCGTP